jgi:oxygen-independent coproporphyrinogen-3 oxidase
MSIIPIVTAAPSGAVPVAAAVRSPSRVRLAALPPLALYVHFPWCVRKCPYCDFNSHEAAGGVRAIPEHGFLQALRADLESALPLVWGRRVISIFFGGGTPSLLSAAGLDALLSDVRALLPLHADCEITLEANPGTVEAARFAAYCASGINRLSIGVQSFDEAKLRALGRVHDRQQALNAIAAARDSFENYNIDLMYGLPGQSAEQLRDDVETVLALAPPHLSIYQLTIEPNTVFAKQRPTLPDDDAVANMQAYIEERTASAGYRHYEVSAYAQPRHECRHNLNYWNFGDYLGIGPGAHSKISFPDRIVRQVRYSSPASYLARAPQRDFVSTEYEVTVAELPFEFMLNAMRLLDGVPAAAFSERTGLAPTAIEAPLRQAIERGLLEADHQRWRPTPLGMRFLNDLQALFLPASA